MERRLRVESNERYIALGIANWRGLAWAPLLFKKEMDYNQLKRLAPRICTESGPFQEFLSGPGVLRLFSMSAHDWLVADDSLSS
jgi:hypothetical protein